MAEYIACLEETASQTLKDQIPPPVPIDIVLREWSMPYFTLKQSSVQSRTLNISLRNYDTRH